MGGFFSVAANNVSLEISKEGKVVKASWLGYADGGEIVEEQTKEYFDIDFDGLIHELKTACSEKDYDKLPGYYWSISFYDSEGKKEHSVEFIEIEILSWLLDIIEDYLGDEAPVQNFREIMD